MATKRSFLSGYKTYDPQVEGYGNASEWRSAFKATMGLDEARTVMGDSSPWDVLNVARGSAWTVIVSAYKAALRAVHPDRCAIHGLSKDVATERTKQTVAAFTMLKAQYGK